MLLPACSAPAMWRWISRLSRRPWPSVLALTAGRRAASGGWSHSWVTPTSRPPRPRANTISVALGRSEQMRNASVIAGQGSWRRARGQGARQAFAGALPRFPRRKVSRLEDGYQGSFLAFKGNPIQDFENGVVTVHLTRPTEPTEPAMCVYCKEVPSCDHERDACAASRGECCGECGHTSSAFYKVTSPYADGRR